MKKKDYKDILTTFLRLFFILSIPFSINTGIPLIVVVTCVIVNPDDFREG